MSNAMTNEDLVDQLRDDSPTLIDGNLVPRPGEWPDPTDAFTCGERCSHGGVCGRVHGHNGPHTTGYCRWDATSEYAIGE